MLVAGFPVEDRQVGHGEAMERECAEDFGERMMIQSRASGLSTVKFLTYNRRRRT